MDFYVYDNIYTFNKMYPAQKNNPLSHLKIKQVAITEQKAFWFETDMEREVRNINVNKPYLHIHQGMETFSKMQFDKGPYFIDMKSIIYNPKSKKIEIKKPGSWFWNKPFYIKNVKGHYYGASIPLKKIKTLGDWIYDFHNDRIFIILNYYPGYRDFTHQAS